MLPTFTKVPAQMRAEGAVGDGVARCVDRRRVASTAFNSELAQPAPSGLSSEDAAWLEDVYGRCCAKFSAERDRVGGKIPYIAEDGVYRVDMAKACPDGWVNGFWPGILWQMYGATGDSSYVLPAHEVEVKLDDVLAKFTGIHHDVGFMWLLSAVADWRLTGAERSYERGLHAATILAGRYNPAGKFIRAWNEPGREGWAIVDSLMNIPLLYWATDQTGDPRFAYIAKSHADTLLNTVVRPDGSCNHIVVLDPMTGELLDAPAGQGYAPGSAWSRGQSWAVYGFALSYRHTGEQRYLDAAKRVASYVCAQLALTHGLSLLDYRQPDEPVRWDAIADCVTACGLLEIVDHVPACERSSYLTWALEILRAVEANWCDWEPSRDGLVQMCSGRYDRESDLHVPMVYGDYYFLEAILRMTGRATLLW